MSIRVLHWSFGLPLTGHLRLVLLVLADRADHYGRCYHISIAEIASVCGFSECDTAEYLRQLCTKRFITIAHYTQSSSCDTPTYLLLIQRTAEYFLKKEK